MKGDLDPVKLLRRSSLLLQSVELKVNSIIPFLFKSLILKFARCQLSIQSYLSEFLIFLLWKIILKPQFG